MSHSQLQVLLLLTVKSLTLPAKNISPSDFNIDHLMMACVEFLLVLLEAFVCHDQCSLDTTVSHCLASFCTPRPSLSITPGISWLPNFAFYSPTIKRTSFFFFFFCISSRTPCRSSYNLSPSVSQHQQLGHTVMLNSLPREQTEIILSFLRLHPSTTFQALLLTMKATAFLPQDSCL